MKSKFLKILIVLALAFLTFILYVRLVDPYSPITIIKPPFSAYAKKGEIKLVKNYQPIFIDNLFSKFLTYLIMGVKIPSFAFFPEAKLSGNNAEIIGKIHKERFDPSKPYVITGGQFSELYIRNLGIFYASLLDSCSALSQTDWENRQRITLQTIALDLEYFKTTKEEKTTIVPLGGNFYTSININARPSDSLHAVLFTLDKFIDPQSDCYKMQTTPEAKKLLFETKDTLKRLVKNYQDSVIDKKSGIIRKNIYLSSARDGVKRESSFYDNVIAWKTFYLAKKLGISDFSDNYLNNLKTKIIDNFWDEKEGIFLNDLSSESKIDKIFGGDFTIAVTSGFLNLDNKADREKIIKQVNYIEKNKLSSPFPLLYAKRDDPKKMYFFVGNFVASYNGESIWSHVGTDYIQILNDLSKFDCKYRNLAEKYLKAYSNNIQKNGGYPELYDKNGNFFTTFVYHSVLHSGWVVGYEEAAQVLKQNAFCKKSLKFTNSVKNH